VPEVMERPNMVGDACRLECSLERVHVVIDDERYALLRVAEDELAASLETPCGGGAARASRRASARARLRGRRGRS
jgi:hypothetical protein